MRIAALILLLGLPLAAQITVVGESAAGGAPTDATYWLGSANGSLSAEIVVNDIESLKAAIGAYDFNDAANLTTGDIAAARMQTNVRTAIGAGLTDGQVPYISGGILTGGSGLNFNGTTLQVMTNWYITDSQVAGAGSGVPILDRSTSSTRGYRFGLDTDTGIDWIAANSFGFESGGSLFMTIGGSQTALIQDQTATTGDTLLKVLSGAGESGNCQEWDDDGTGALASVDCETGNSVFSNVTLGTTGATFYGPSASEPVDCTTANDGSMYFDTDDQKLCICANDGTDDEWLHSDNYGHGSGHCSI